MPDLYRLAYPLTARQRNVRDSSMLLALITAGDADDCRAVVYNEGEPVTYDEGSWAKVRGNLRLVGLCQGRTSDIQPSPPDGGPPPDALGSGGLVGVDGPTAPITGRGGPIRPIALARPHGRAVRHKPVKRHVIKLG